MLLWLLGLGKGKISVLFSLKRPVKYNPEESETYKALKEEELGGKVQEVTVPPQSKVFTPNKTIPPKVIYN